MFETITWPARTCEQARSGTKTKHRQGSRQELLRLGFYVVFCSQLQGRHVGWCEFHRSNHLFKKRTLLLMHATELEPELVRATMNVLLKFQSDIELVDLEVPAMIHRASVG